jgi:hypothetical protein
MLIRSSGGRFELEYGCGLSFFLKAPVVEGKRIHMG